MVVSVPLVTLLVGVLFFLCPSSLSHAAPLPTFPLYSSYAGKPYTVTYDRRSLRLNDQPVAFLSGSIHYPRSTPAMWPQLVQQAAADGLNMIEIYVFWNYHQRSEETVDWTDRGNLTLFLDTIARAGLFANLRIGPYVCAEWDYGGIPAWLGFKPDMRYRCYNQPWMDAVQRWFQTVVNVTRTYFADHGGPIVLAQVENELNQADVRYVDWNGQLAASMNVNVPWIMCNGQSANNTIDTCNASDCADFIDTGGQNGRILVDQPALWTENEGWFEELGQPTHPEDSGTDRRADEIAYTVARWFARGGCHMNYYMYHGGNHYDSWGTGGAANMYANGVNLHSDGLPNEPKHTHLSLLHFVLAYVSDDLLAHDAQSKHAINLPWRYNVNMSWETGTQQLAYVYGRTVFIESNAGTFVQVQYNGTVYDMSANTVLILRAAELLFNTSAVRPVRVKRVNTPVWAAPLEWQVWGEGVYSNSDVPSAAEAGMRVVQTPRPVEQLNLTRDLTDYCWYTTVVNVPSALTAVNISVDTASANSLLVFVNGQYAGQCEDHRKEGTTDHVQCNVTVGDVAAGTLQLSILSVSFGIGNGVDRGEDPLQGHFKGIRSSGSVYLANLDITYGSWTQRPYLTGQYLALPTASGHSSVRWSTDWRSVMGRPITWYYAELKRFDVPSGLHSVLIDLTGFMRGHCYINGHDIGRYWLIPTSDGLPTQLLYHIPPDWLNWGEGAINTVTVLEELGSVDPSLVRVYVSQMLPMAEGEEEVVRRPRQSRTRRIGHLQTTVDASVGAEQ